MFSDPKEILVITVSKIPCLICACVGFFSIIVLRSSLRVYGVKRSIYRQSFYRPDVGVKTTLPAALSLAGT